MTKFISPHRIGTHPLKGTMHSVEAAMNRLNHAVGFRKPHKRKYLSGSTVHNSMGMVGQMASPFLRSASSAFFGAGTATQGSQGLSQGQMLSDLASGIARTSRRYL